MILVTGATGRIGRRVVERLSEAGQVIRVLVRDRQKAQDLFADGVELCEGNLSDYEAVQAAVAGAGAVMLLSPVAPDQVVLQGNVVTAALAAGKPYIVKISGLGTALDSPVDSGRWHAETELQIQSAGLPYTFLQPLFFMQNLAFQFDSARSKGLIRAGVGDARIAMIDVEDIADFAAKLLVDGNLLRDESVVLSALESVTYHDVASALTEVFGREVRYKQQSLDKVKRSLQASGQPAWHIDILLQFNQAFLEGKGDVTNSIVADILGRPPTTLLQYLRREAKDSVQDQGTNPFPN